MDNIHLLSISLLVILFSVGCITVSPEMSSDLNATLSRVESGINQELQNINQSNANVANQLSGIGLSGKSAEKILLDHFLAHPWAISSATVSNESILVGIAPDSYQDVIGTDLTFQEQTVQIIQAQAPRVSTVFPIVEGVNAIVQSYPVFAPDGTYLGYADITYRPEVFISRIAEPLLNNTPYEALVIQTDGVVLYSTPMDEIGGNIFSDPNYQDPEHRVLFARIAAEPSGLSSYRSSDPDHENRIVAWSTAGIDGAPWRVIISRIAP